MTYKADRLFGSWLEYFERLPESGLTDAIVSAVRKWPEEQQRIEWAIKVLFVSKQVEALRRFSAA